MKLMALKLMCITLAVSSSALKAVAPSDSDAAKLIEGHLSQIPDIEPTFIQNTRLGKIISRLFKGKLSVLPLFNISVKLDRTPVELPWNMNQTAINEVLPEAYRPKHIKEYELVPGEKLNKTAK